MHKKQIFIRFIIILLACCDVIFESDVSAVDIMQEMCRNVLRHHQVDPRVRDALTMGKLTPQSASLCREEVLTRCGIDLAAFLTERERLGKSYKQVLEEIRSFNSSLCLKLNFGIPLSQLGTPHLIRYHILMPHSKKLQKHSCDQLTFLIMVHISVNRLYINLVILTLFIERGKFGSKIFKVYF